MSGSQEGTQSSITHSLKKRLTRKRKGNIEIESEAQRLGRAMVWLDMVSLWNTQQQLATNKALSGSKRRVVTFFREVFDIASDRDFISHETANPTDINDYLQDIGDGPDPEDLHFDMISGPDSVWNRRMLQLLLEKLKEEDRDDLPERSDEYWIDLMAKRFTNLQPTWRKGQRRMKPCGGMESAEEVQNRVATGFDDDDVVARRATRRRHVSSMMSEGD
jgi:hypothetical protein